MKKGFLSLVIVLIAIASFSQDTLPKKEELIRRNFFINVVPDNYNKPLIGIVNLANGSHTGLQSSFLNWNQDNFDGIQVSLLNIVGGNVGGGQVGVVNIGAKSLEGIQFGVVNCTKNRKGTQVGLINYSDTVTNGSAIAVLSIVRKGYQGIELGVTEMYKYNISYKIGLRKQYSSANFSFNDSIQKPVFGFGFGSIISTKSKHLFVNPDFSLQNGIFKSKQGMMSVSVKLSYAIWKRLHISAGPSVVWAYARKVAVNQPLYSIYEYSINFKNNILVGIRCSLRYNIKGM